MMEPEENGVAAGARAGTSGGSSVNGAVAGPSTSRSSSSLPPPASLMKLPNMFANWTQLTQSNNVDAITVRTNLLDHLEDVFTKQRLEVVDKDGFLITPLHIVKKLAEEHNQRMHSEVYVIHHGDADFKDMMQRVEIFIGQARGIGQAPVRGLAFQLAAIDMLEKIKFYNQEKFPLYGLPLGTRIHPKVMGHLMAFCRLNNLEYPKIEVKNSGVPLEERELFDCFVSMGGLTTTAKSDNRYMARRLAVKEMYNKVSLHPYPEMPLAIGGQCVGLARLRELGITAMISATKRDWLQEHRGTAEGKMMHFQEEEPDDGDMLDPKDVVTYNVHGEM